MSLVALPTSFRGSNLVDTRNPLVENCRDDMPGFFETGCGRSGAALLRRRSSHGQPTGANSALKFPTHVGAPDVTPDS